MGESTARGSGRNASGPLIATWQMLEWIRDNGPADRDTIIENCSRLVDVGYARRWYQRHGLTPRPERKVKGAITGVLNGPAIATAPLEGIPGEKARRAVIVNLLKASRQNGTTQLDAEGFYHYLRMPTRTPAGLAVEAVTSDERITRRHVYERELVQRLRAADKRGSLTAGGKNMPALALNEREALFRWLSTFDDLDAQQITVTGIELEAIVTLRAMRSRQSAMTRPRETNTEKGAIRALWLALDNFAK